MSALSGPVPRDVLKPFWRDFQSTHPEVKDPRRVSRTIARIFLFAIASGCVVVGAWALSGVIPSLIASGAQRLANSIGSILTCAIVMAGGAYLFRVFFRSFSQRVSPTKNYRLAQFAATNNMDYLPGPTSGSYLKPWAQQVVFLQVSRVLRTRTEPSVEFGNFEERYINANQNSFGFGGYAAIRLDTHLPNMLLLSHVNVTGTDIWRPIPLHAEKMSLEGNFDNYFTLYAPVGYEVDALYLFTPDVMVNLMDEAAAFDVEIIDDWVFLTTRRDAVTTDPKRWSMVAGAVAAITAKLDQWQRWSDDRVKPGPSQNEGRFVRTNARYVALQGRRLRRGGSKGTWLAVGVTVVLILATILRPGGLVDNVGGSTSASPSPTATAPPTPGSTPT